MRRRLGVVIGRFQVPELHDGHKRLIQCGLDRCDHVLILLGLPKTGKPSDDDPLSAELRKRLILKSLINPHKVTIQTIKGRSDDKVWSENVDTIIENMEYDSIRLYGGPDSFIPYYTGKYKTVEVDAFDSPQSGTTIREEIGKAIPTDRKDLGAFAKGVIWSQENRYPVNVPVVDVMVFKDEKEEEILLGRKEGEYKWRFCGGYVDIADESFEHAATRELGEEMGLYPGQANMKYVMSHGINDWRYSKSKDRMISTVFKTYAHVGGLNQAKAGDDLVELKLFKLSFTDHGIYLDADSPETLIEDHFRILNQYFAVAGKSGPLKKLVREAKKAKVETPFVDYGSYVTPAHPESVTEVLDDMKKSDDMLNISDE